MHTLSMLSEMVDTVPLFTKSMSSVSFSITADFTVIWGAFWVDVLVVRVVDRGGRVRLWKVYLCEEPTTDGATTKNTAPTSIIMATPTATHFRSSPPMVDGNSIGAARGLPRILMDYPAVSVPKGSFPT